MPRILVSIMAVPLLVTAGRPAAAVQQFINVLAGGTSGVCYPLGVALSNIYAKAIPDAKSSAQATKASVENLGLRKAGRGEIAFTLGPNCASRFLTTPLIIACAGTVAVTG